MASEQADALARPMPVGAQPLRHAFGGPVARLGVGLVAQRSLAFGQVLGLSTAQRSAVRPATGDLLHSVRMPEGVWPGSAGQDEHPALSDPGMAAIARLYSRRAAPKRAAAVHGLPRVSRRAARTSVGPMTGPSAVARRLVPGETRVQRNDSHGAATTDAASRPTPAGPTAPRAATPPAPRGEAPVVTPDVLRSAQAYARADTPDAKAAAFAAAMGAASAAASSAEPTFTPPGTRRAADVRQRSSLWAAAAGRAGGFDGDDAPTGDTVADDADAAGGPTAGGAASAAAATRGADAPGRATSPSPSPGAAPATPGGRRALGASTAVPTVRRTVAPDRGDRSTVPTGPTHPAGPAAAAERHRHHHRGGLPALRSVARATPSLVVATAPTDIAPTPAPVDPPVAFATAALAGDANRRARAAAPAGAPVAGGSPAPVTVRRLARAAGSDGRVFRRASAPPSAATAVPAAAPVSAMTSSAATVSAVSTPAAPVVPTGGVLPPAERGPSGVAPAPSAPAPAVGRAVAASPAASPPRPPRPPRSVLRRQLDMPRAAALIRRVAPAATPVTSASPSTSSSSGVPAAVPGATPVAAPPGGHAPRASLAARRASAAGLFGASSRLAPVDGSVSGRAEWPDAVSSTPPPAVTPAHLPAPPPRASASAAPPSPTVVAAPLARRHAALVVRRRTATAGGSLPVALGPSTPTASTASTVPPTSTSSPTAAPAAAAPPTVPGGAGPVHPAAAAMQARFLESLERTGPARASALPERLRPLARGLTSRPILVAHDGRARAALRSVDRPAATLGNVVHLQRAPDDSPASMELIAHELVHAASAPTRPRFFAEPGDDHEERHAHRVGQVARRATAQRLDPATLPLGRGPVVLPRVVQRTPSDEPAISRSIAPAPMAGGAAAAVHRAVDERVQRTPASSGGRASSGSSRGATIRRTMEGSATSSGSSGGGERVSAPTTTQVINELEELIELIERRVINSLERRGGRVRGNW